eukprot:gene65187-89192_t
MRRSGATGAVGAVAGCPARVNHSVVGAPFRGSRMTNQCAAPTGWARATPLPYPDADRPRGRVHSRAGRGSVLVDVSIDQGGCFETSRPTTHKDPTYTVDGV